MRKGTAWYLITWLCIVFWVVVWVVVCQPECLQIIGAVCVKLWSNWPYLLVASLLTGIAYYIKGLWPY